MKAKGGNAPGQGRNPRKGLKESHAWRRWIDFCACTLDEVIVKVTGKLWELPGRR